MIVLDTNVISELMRTSPAALVTAWVVKAASEGLYITAVTRAEIMMGIAILPDGRHRSSLASAAAFVLSRTFEGYTLPFDASAADHYADIVASRRRQGRPISAFDAMILAIARSHGAAVATRNLRDFEGVGVALMDPWSGA